MRIEDQIQVRLVPTAAGALREGRAPAPLRSLLGRGILWNLIENDALQLTTRPAVVESLFQTELIRKNGRLSTKNALKVPEFLSDLIAFAYVPTPVQYCSPVLSPPKPEAHHLQLDEVSSVIGAHKCHSQKIKGEGKTVAVIDTGLAPHPFFEHHGFKIKPIKNSPGGNAELDEEGHGTGVAANVFAAAPGCTVLGVKGFAAESLAFCLKQKPDVINCSWGWDIDYFDLMTFAEEEPNLYWELVEVESILRKIKKAGITTLFAAGNGGRMAPGCFPDVLTVGGITMGEDGEIRASNHASGYESAFYPGRNVPDLCGVMGESDETGSHQGHILLPVPKGSDHDGENLNKKSGWGLFSGTSSATPQVAGVVAMMLQVNPTLTPDQVKEILVNTSRDVVGGRCYMGDEAGVGADLATGAGYVDAWAACEAARERAQD